MKKYVKMKSIVTPIYDITDYKNITFIYIKITMRSLHQAQPLNLYLFLINRGWDGHCKETTVPGIGTVSMVNRK